MTNFYTTKTKFRQALTKEIERLRDNSAVNSGDGRLLLNTEDIKNINGLLLQYGFSKRVLLSEMDLYGLKYDEEKMIITKK